MQLFTNIQEELIERINQSKDSLKIAVTWFTNHDLFNAVIKKLDNPAYKVTLIVLNDRINNSKQGVNFQKLIDCNGSFYYSSFDKMVHDKFCIIDDKIVITGSYNWTYKAEYINWENVVIMESTEAVKAYSEEFNKIIQKHEQVDSVATKQKFDLDLDSNEFIINEFKLQSKQEEQRGNDLAVAKIYTEILRINYRQPEIIKARINIVQKINSQRFETCPFEIGIHFLSGYKKIISAFTPLPITNRARGCDPYGNSERLRTTIEKYDYFYSQLLQFSLDNLKPCPIDTPKLNTH